MKTQWHKEDGFTLIEVMTSMFIMGFSLLLLLHLAMIALDGNTWASGTTTSTQLLQDKLEYLRAQANPTTGMDTVNAVIRHWTVNAAGSHLRQVAISATWLTPDSMAQTYTINSYIKTEAP